MLFRTGIFLTIPLRIHSPVERMLKISRNMGSLSKAPAVPLVVSTTFDWVSLLPVWILRSIYNKMMPTLGMTSFPGPEEEIVFMDNARLVDIYSALGHMTGKLGKNKISHE